MNKRLGLANIDFIFRVRHSEYYSIVEKIRLEINEKINKSRFLGTYSSNKNPELNPNNIEIYLNNIYFCKKKIWTDESINNIIKEVIEHESLHSAFQQTLPELNKNEHYVQFIQSKLGSNILPKDRVIK